MSQLAYWNSQVKIIFNACRSVLSFCSRDRDGS